MYLVQKMLRCLRLSYSLLLLLSVVKRYFCLEEDELNCKGIIRLLAYYVNFIY